MISRKHILIYIIASLVICRIFAQEKSFIPYKLKNKWVVLDTSCRIISKEKYDTVYLMVDGFAQVKQKNKWGYINKNAVTVIPIIYDEIFKYGGWYYNFARVRIKNDTFFIDNKGQREKIKERRRGCGETAMIMNFAAQEIKGKNGFGLLYNVYGMTEEQIKHPDTLVPCIYKKIVSTIESPFAILINNKYSLYNTVNKKMLITDCDTMFFYGKNGTPHWIVFIKKNLKGFVTPNGTNLLEPTYKYLKIINTDFIYVTDAKNQSYFINSAGKKFTPSHARNKNKIDTTFKYEVRFIIGQRDGQIILNKKTGIADTNLAFVKGQFKEPDKDSTAFADVIFINEDRGTKQRIATNVWGRYKIFLKSGKYTVLFGYVGRPTIKLTNLLLIQGQRQEVNICLGDNGITHTVLVKSKSPLTEKELQQKAEKLKKEFIKKQKKELAEKIAKQKHGVLTDNLSPTIYRRID
jgi:RNA-binding protein YhbY